MIHPSQTELALFAGGDSALPQRLRISWHLYRCDRCSDEVETYREARELLLTESHDVLADADWNRLSMDMIANIHLGLEAGECVGPVRVKQSGPSWRTVVLTASMCSLLLCAWVLNIPGRRPAASMHAGQIEVRTTSAGIELSDNGNTLTLMHNTSGGQKPLIVSMPGTLRARYVDDKTGQVTINNVYAD